MKLSAREDIEAPIEFVFDRVSDFALLERSAMRRGVEVVRHEVEGKTSWALAFAFRGKPRKAQVTLEKVEPLNALVARFSSGGLDGHTVVELIALSRNRTRISISAEFMPQTLSARLMVQSLRLAKMTISRRFKARVADIAEEIEEGYRG
ncbi:MAG TPA: SRPBCC family protein [Paracoccaceae bacterium]|nr:SRPBCC family protein [Paracoccaceae bacterium]